LQNTRPADTATFAGGCFWCIEAAFEQIKGVQEAVSGYAGGNRKNPTYEQVARGQTEHAETVQVYYDPQMIDYGTLLDIFFTAHDPTQLNRQGPDVGKQYRSAIFYHNPIQRQEARDKINKLDRSDQYTDPVVTKLNAYKAFYKATEYHQNYEQKHPNDRYIQKVSRPKINKVKQKFPDLIKEAYK
jgi:peptide-methionine (S)-S-oxide reductase